MFKSKCLSTQRALDSIDLSSLRRRKKIYGFYLSRRIWPLGRSTRGYASSANLYLPRRPRVSRSEQWLSIRPAWCFALWLVKSFEWYKPYCQQLRAYGLELIGHMLGRQRAGVIGTQQHRHQIGTGEVTLPRKRVSNSLNLTFKFSFWAPFDLELVDVLEYPFGVVAAETPVQMSTPSCRSSSRLTAIGLIAVLRDRITQTYDSYVTFFKQLTQTFLSFSQMAWFVLFTVNGVGFVSFFQYT